MKFTLQNHKTSESVIRNICGIMMFWNNAKNLPIIWGEKVG